MRGRFANKNVGARTTTPRLAEDAPASDAKHDTGPLSGTETLTCAVFSTSSYMRHTQTNVLNEAFGASNVRSLDVSLSPTTAPLAAGCNAVCLFVNDSADAETIDILADLGVRFIAMRCAGYDRVDLDACQRRGVAVARGPSLLTVRNRRARHRDDARAQPAAHEGPRARPAR
jgi:D-lactate dehydrogenase